MDGGTEVGDAGARLTPAEAVQRAVGALAAGRLIVVVDDADREDEGDLVAAADSITADQMAFIVANTTGIVCTPMPEDRQIGYGFHLWLLTTRTRTARPSPSRWIISNPGRGFPPKRALARSEHWPTLIACQGRCVALAMCSPYAHVKAAC